MAAENKGPELKGEARTRNTALEVKDIKVEAKDEINLLKIIYVKGIHGQGLKSGKNYNLNNEDEKDSSGGQPLFYSPQTFPQTQ